MTTTGSGPTGGGGGTAILYVPPESYLDSTRSPLIPVQYSLSADEITRMSVIVEVGGSDVGIQPFELRRPPLVLIHGIMSNPATWGSPMWTEGGGGVVPTRMYKVDWSTANSTIPRGGATKGYAENVPMLSAVIHEAIEDYRSGRDLAPNNHGHRSPASPDLRGFQGKRYAATRVDVAGHSQGGQVTRLYLSDVTTLGLPSGYSRDGVPVSPPSVPPSAGASTVWDSFYAVRSLVPANGLARWNLRGDNFYAGDIRRFIPLGSPFKGSEIANTVEPWFRPTPINIAILEEAMELNRVPGHIRAMLFTSAGSYIAPTCVADLQVGSPAQGLLEAATYPVATTAPWVPIVGIATESIGEESLQGALWEVLFHMVGIVNNIEWDYEVSPLNPTNGDLIVGQWSQRNASGAGDTRASTGHMFTYTAHVPVAGYLDGETGSVKIGTAGQSSPLALPVSDLLSGTRLQLNGGGLGQ